MNSIHLVPVEGRVPYAEGLAWQRSLARARIAGGLQEDLVLLVEHDPVLTIGRGGSRSNIVASKEVLAVAGVDTVEVERGGDVTYHGPGQMVGYPILDLTRWRKDLHWYLRQLEQALIDTLRGQGVQGFRYPGYTGVWVGDQRVLSAAGRAEGRVRKIASIGVHVSRWVTWHGFALNVTDEPLHNFRLISPCGIDDVRMTTLESEGAPHGWEAVRSAVGYGLEHAFACRVHQSPPVRVGEHPVLDSTTAFSI